MPVLGAFVQGGSAKLFLPIRNTYGSSLTTGMGTGLAIGNTASNDGNQALLCASGTANTLPGFIGIMTSDLANTNYGIVQCYGMTASVFLSGTNTSVTINNADPLAPGAQAGGLTSLAPTYAASGLKWVICSNPPTNTVSVAGTQGAGGLYASGYVRCV